MLVQGVVLGGAASTRRCVRQLLRGVLVPAPTGISLWLLDADVLQVVEVELVAAVLVPRVPGSAEEDGHDVGQGFARRGPLVDQLRPRPLGERRHGGQQEHVGHDRQEDVRGDAVRGDLERVGPHLLAGHGDVQVDVVAREVEGEGGVLVLEDEAEVLAADVARPHAREVGHHRRQVPQHVRRDVGLAQVTQGLRNLVLVVPGELALGHLKAVVLGEELVAGH